MTRIVLTEPKSPRYIFVNAATNIVHLMMPVVSGTAIGLDNTCKTVFALMGFFGKSDHPEQVTVLNQLLLYKDALEFDIVLLKDEPSLKEKKESRLMQINEYIILIKKIQNNGVLDTLDNQYPTYPEPIIRLMHNRDANLYSMVLRPAAQDIFLRVTNPVFSVRRTNDASANPDSFFYKALQDIYQGVKLESVRARLTAAVLASIGKTSPSTAKPCIDFETIQQELSKKTQELLGENVDFTKKEITKAFIDNEMGFDDGEATPSEYVHALLGYCAPNLFELYLADSPFYTIQTAEALSILTQFFFATVNIYCYAHGLSRANFGKVLDDSDKLSTAIAFGVTSALSSNADIELFLLDFVNENRRDFELHRELTDGERSVIRTRFTEYYAEIKDSPHFDEFMVLLPEKKEPFVVHQGSICIDFCSFLSESNEDTPFILERLRDLKSMDILHSNEWIACDIELNIKSLTDEELTRVLEKLPKETLQELIQSHPDQMMQMVNRQVYKKFDLFFHCVVRGQGEEAEHLLLEFPYAQHLLLMSGNFIDCSGRIFNQCTVYEYSYWAGDVRVCRMLERHMNDETKAQMFKLIDKIDHEGLQYQQHGKNYTSYHFDLGCLKNALRNYYDQYADLIIRKEFKVIETLAMEIGSAQQDVPAHVALEYCRIDRSFYPLPSFDINKESPSKSLDFFNYEYNDKRDWYSPDSGLGTVVAVFRGDRKEPVGVSRSLGYKPTAAWADFQAVSRLNEVTIAEISRSFACLRTSVHGLQDEPEIVDRQSSLNM